MKSPVAKLQLLNDYLSLFYRGGLPLNLLNTEQLVYRMSFYLLSCAAERNDGLRAASSRKLST